MEDKKDRLIKVVDMIEEDVKRDTQEGQIVPVAYDTGYLTALATVFSILGYNDLREKAEALKESLKESLPGRNK